MKAMYLLLAILAFMLNSCMSIAWIGFKKPVESDFTKISDDTRCMQVALQSLEETEVKSIREAAADVCEIFYSEEFKERVIAQNWLASCAKKNGKPDEMSGQEVYELMMKNIPRYSIHSRKPWNAVAQTQKDESNFVYNRVAIKPKRIKAWESATDTIKSELVNTIAHETTHIIAYEFADAGHGTDECPDSNLVSYGIGNLVEELWLKNKAK